MKAFSSTNQGGSVAGFLLIGVVLISLAVGGVYFAQQRDGAEESTAPKPGSTSKTGDSDVKEKKKQDNKNSPAKTNEDKATSSVARPGSGASGEELPQSGPADALISILLVAILAGVATSYVQSVVRYRESRVTSRLD